MLVPSVTEETKMREIQEMSVRQGYEVLHREIRKILEGGGCLGWEYSSEVDHLPSM